MTIDTAELIARLGRKEQELKSAGAYAEAAGVRSAIVVALRLVDEVPGPIDPSE